MLPNSPLPSLANEYPIPYTHRRKISSSACSFSTEALTVLCLHSEKIREKKGEGVEKRAKASRDRSSAASSLHRRATCELSPTGARGMRTPPQEQSDRGNSDSWRFRRQGLKGCGAGGGLRWEGTAGCEESVGDGWGAQDLDGRPEEHYSEEQGRPGPRSGQSDAEWRRA
jgi:hypothetical protein